MAKEQTDPDAQERIIAQFQRDQRTKKLEEKNERRRKYLEFWEDLRPSIPGVFYCMMMLAWMWVDSASNRPSRYLIVVLFGAMWLLQIEGRIISVQRDLARLKEKRENKDGEKS